MRLIIFVCLLGAVLTHAAQPQAGAPAKPVGAPCTVSGAKYPELMPEYYVWEAYFRSLTLAASGQIEGVTPPPGKQFHPTIVSNNARYLGVSDDDLLAFLEIGDRALKKVDQLRTRESHHVGPDADRQARLETVEVILDARDDLARRLTPAAMRAIRRNSPARGSAFDFPVEQ
jgi:hypothetical protein